MLSENPGYFTGYVCFVILKLVYYRLLERIRQTNRRRRLSVMQRNRERRFTVFRKAQEQELNMFTMICFASMSKQRDIWSKPRFQVWWENIQTISDDDFVENFRVKRDTFQYIVEKLRPVLRRADTPLRKCITTEMRVAVTLKRLSSNMDFGNISNLFGIGRSTACEIVQEVIDAICKVLSPKHIKFPTGERLAETVSGFEDRWNFPQCCGAIDGTHIPIQGPKDSKADYYNRKGFYSIQVQAVCDHRGIFTDLTVGWPGKVHDARVFASSSIFRRFDSGDLVNNNVKEMDGVEVPVHIIGDQAYPLLPWLMKRYTEQPDMEEYQRQFNYRLSSARMVIECAFGKLKGGKRDEKLILPVNSSISVTLSQDQLRAKTTITASEDFSEDRIWLNGREENINTPRIQNLLHQVKCRASTKPNGINSDLIHWKLHICSENNFPTAAGLASSAAGYACLAYTLSKLFEVEGDVSQIARLGSGSACRSIYGGFVQWKKGEKDDGSDSVAEQIATHHHWPGLRILILVVSDQKKAVGSTAGMQSTVNTSQLFCERVRCVEGRNKQMNEAILYKDFSTFAELTMKDSNQLHAVCLDTYPPISYLTDTSRHIITLVHSYNRYYGENKVAYTFDAGPNACLFMMDADVPRILSLVNHFFPPGDIEEDFVTGSPIQAIETDKSCLSAIPLPIQRGAIKYVIHTRPGPGPQILDDENSLLDDNGLPKSLVDCAGSKRKYNSNS